MAQWYSKVNFQTGWNSGKRKHHRGMMFIVEADTRLEAEKKVLGKIDREYRGGRVDILILEERNGQGTEREEYTDS